MTRLASPYPPLVNGIDAALNGTDAGIAKRLLVVDDEDSIRHALTRFLSARGFQVENASSGAAALSMLGRERFTLMVCDVRMPGMTGLDVLHRALADDPDLAVVMLTAVNDAVTATEALSGGAFDYLVKPVELQQLESALERAMHKRTLVLEQRRVEQLIRDEVASRTKELEHEQAALRTLTVNAHQRDGSQEHLPARTLAACRGARRVNCRRPVA